MSVYNALQGYLQLLGDTRHARAIERKQKVVTRDCDTGVAWYIHIVGVSVVPRWVQRDTPLIRIDSMCGATESNHIEGCHGASGGDLDRVPDGGGARRVADGGARGMRAVIGEQVWRIVDLGVVVVGGATLTAEASSTREDGSVVQEKSNAVVGSGNGLWRSLHKIEGIRVPELRGELCRIVRERRRDDLATGDKDRTGRQNDAIGEGALKIHVIYLRHLRVLVGTGEGDDVGVDSGDGGSVRVSLVVGSTPKGQDLASRGVVHDRVAVHRVSIIGAGAGAGLAALPTRAVPVHVSARAGLEDAPVLPREEPAMVVGTVNALHVVGEHWTDGAAGQRGPRVGVGIVDFTVLIPLSATPGAANHKGTTVGDGALGLVASTDDHVRRADPIISRGIVYARPLVVVTAGDDDASVEVQRQAGAEHVMVGVGDNALGDDLGVRVVAGRHGLTAIAVGEGARGV